MKLQRNNKYARRITAGLGALVVSLGILTGCNNSSVFSSKDTIVIETINSNDHLKESLNDPDYSSNYFNISEDELQNRSIKYFFKNDKLIADLSGKEFHRIITRARCNKRNDEDNLPFDTTYYVSKIENLNSLKLEYPEYIKFLELP